MIYDPVIVDPPEFNQAAAWQACRDYVEQCGGMPHPDESMNLHAAFGANPGCCKCPACPSDDKRYYWAWGRLIRCTACSFVFPPNWWPMYLWGVQARKRDVPPAPNWVDNPYYRYGYTHPVEDPLQEKNRIDWKMVLGEQGGNQ